MESMTPIAKHGSFLIDLKIKNHLAMSRLTRGQANRDDIEKLMAVINVVEALHRMGFGREYKDVVNGGLDALQAVGKRGATTGRFILRAQEMMALNTMMELHDAQMDIITVKDLEKAVAIVEAEFRAGRMRTIVEKKNERAESAT